MRGAVPVGRSAPLVERSVAAPDVEGAVRQVSGFARLLQPVIAARSLR